MLGWPHRYLGVLGLGSPLPRIFILFRGLSPHPAYWQIPTADTRGWEVNSPPLEKIAVEQAGPVDLGQPCPFQGQFYLGQMTVVT